MNKLINFFLLLFSITIANAQSVEVVLNKLNSVYSESSPLQFEMIYNLYKNKSSNKVYESYKGVFKKNEKNEIYQKIDKTEFIWNNKTCLSVFHQDQLMTLSFSEPQTNKQFDIKKMLEICSVKSFKDKKAYWELILESKPFSGLEYSEILIQINKNYFIQKQLFYYNTSIDFSNNMNKQDISLPVLEIIFSNYNRKKIDTKIFDITKYIIQTKNGIQPSKLYQNYDFEDQREVTLK